MKYQTVLFDFDGTLLYTVRDLADAVNHTLALHGYPTHSVEAVERMVGNGVNRLMARALPQGFDTPGYETMMDEFRAYYAAHCGDHTYPYEGIPELLRELRRRGVKTAVVTNKYQQAAELLVERFFAGDIGCTVGDVPGRERKPAPDAVFAALERLDAEKGSAVYVGDTEVDMLTAANAGMDGICVSWGYRRREELEALHAPAIADTAAELLAML